MPARASQPKLPDWLTAVGSVAVVPRDARAVVLYKEELLTVQPDGHAVERIREAVKIVRPDGRDDATPVAWFNRDAKLLSFQVWAIGADGRHFAMKDSEYRDIGFDGGGMLYVDDQIRVAQHPPGADPGGVIAWEYTRQLPSYMSEDSWDLQEDIPVRQAIFEADLPPSWSYENLWFRHSAVAPSELSPNHFRWEVNDVSGLDLEDVPLAPAPRALAARMVLHFASSPLPRGDALWTRIGQWYDDLASAQTEGGSDLKTAALNLSQPQVDYMARLDKVADFMQRHIRYVGIEVGIGGFKPHKAEDVFHNQYGDCKDKVTLLISLLDSLGIRATWVLVDTRRGFIDPNVPSVDGDHAIAAIEIPPGYQNPRLKAVVNTRSGKRFLIFDPTNEFVAIGLLPEYLQGSYGLLVDGKSSQVIQLPVLPSDDDVTTRTASLTLGGDGSLSGEFDVQHTGATAWRQRDFYDTSSPDEQRKRAESMLRADLSAFSLTSTQAENPLQLTHPFQVKYDFKAQDYAHPAGNLLLVRPRVLGTLVERLQDRPREYPISFRSEGTWRDSFDIKLPPGYVVEDVPDPVKIDMPFATYQSSVKAEGGVLHYSREYVLKSLGLPAGDYGSLLKLESAIASDENGVAILKKQ
jgi:hypothetical protein